MRGRINPIYQTKVGLFIELWGLLRRCLSSANTPPGGWRVSISIQLIVSYQTIYTLPPEDLMDSATIRVVSRLEWYAVMRWTTRRRILRAWQQWVLAVFGSQIVSSQCCVFGCEREETKMHCILNFFNLRWLHRSSAAASAGHLCAWQRFFLNKEKKKN